jgi:hypothetical protein
MGHWSQAREIQYGNKNKSFYVFSSRQISPANQQLQRGDGTEL